MTDTMRNTAFLVVLCALLFLTNLSGYDLWSPDEPRFGQVAREMLQSGNYLVPHINGEPYTEKPPLLFWTISICSRYFGDVTELSARLPSVLAATITVLLTYWLGRAMYGERVGVWAGAILATSAMFWWEARTARTDMLLTACLTACLFALWSFHESRNTKWLVAFYAALAAGGLAKGPPAVVFPVLLIITFYWGQKAERKETHWVFGTCAAAAIVLLWLIPARYAISGAEATAAASTIGGDFLRQVVGRAVMGVSKAQWPWYYIEQLPMTWFPWILFFPWAILWVWKRRHEDSPMRFLLCATVPAFIFFSIVIGKRTMYLMPIYPAMAILLSRSILDLMDEPRGRWLKNTALLLAAVLLLAAAAPAGILLSKYKHIWSPEILAFSVCAAGFAIDALRRGFWHAGRGLPAALIGYFTGLTAVAVLIVLPLVNPEKSARDICQPIRALSDEGTEFDLYSLCFSREQYIYYANKFHTPILTDTITVEQYLEGGDAMAIAQEQHKLKRAIMTAVEDVPVADLAHVTDAELASLEQARDAAVERYDGGADQAAQFIGPLRDELDAFKATLLTPTPAFFFVQEEDWRWILPIEPEFRALRVIRMQQVGSRKVLLIANEAGAALAPETVDSP